MIWTTRTLADVSCQLGAFHATYIDTVSVPFGAGPPRRSNATAGNGSGFDIHPEQCETGFRKTDEDLRKVSGRRSSSDQGRAELRRADTRSEPRQHVGSTGPRPSGPSLAPYSITVSIKSIHIRPYHLHPAGEGRAVPGTTVTIDIGGYRNARAVARMASAGFRSSNFDHLRPRKRLWTLRD